MLQHMIMIMPSDLDAELLRLSCNRRLVVAGEVIFRREALVEWLHYIDSGTVHLVRYLKDGGTAVLQRADRGMFLAEASLFSDHYHCDAVAVTDATAIRYRKRDVLGALRTNPSFAASWARYLSREVQRTRARAEILSLRRLSDRLDAWLEANGGEAPARGGWSAVARDIGVTPPALYRELARRRMARG